MLDLCHALFQPHLLYGLSVWGSTFPYSAQQRLQLIQNNAIRAITGKRKFNHISSSYQDLGVLKISDLCKAEIASLTYKLQNSNLHITFNNKFTKPFIVHKYSIRSNQQLTYYISRFRSVRLQRSFIYSAVKLFIFSFLFSCIFILLSRESDQCAMQARLEVAGHLSITPRWSNTAKCPSQRLNK